LSLYGRSVRAELRAVGRLEASFATAEALSSSLQPDVVIDRLLERGMAALEAERAMLCRVSGEVIVVEGSRSDDTPPRPSGEVLPLSAAPYIELAVRRQQVETASAPIAWNGISDTDSELVSGIRHALAVPLLFDSE